MPLQYDIGKRIIDKMTADTPADDRPSVERAKEELNASAKKVDRFLDTDAFILAREDTRRLLRDIAAFVEAAEAALAEARSENDTMRGLLANSALDCVYCGLPVADIGKCASGFPGCARADDMAADTPPEGKKA